MNTEDLQQILNESSSHHSHLCPRQILGARLGLAGLAALGFDAPPVQKRLLIISETDGCFVDGLIAASGCTIGHRTLRVEDFGKTAATFVDTQSGQAIRVAPCVDLRARASDFTCNESRHYFAQIQAYQSMPDQAMFTMTWVDLDVPVDAIIGRPGLRVICDSCGEEIMNEREVRKNGFNFCLPCAGKSYFSLRSTYDAAIAFDLRATAA